MFEYLYGTVEYKKMDYIAIDINGVGYRVYFPLREYEKIEVGNKYKFYIYNHIKEDTYKLIGFLEEGDRKIFELLLKINGIGSSLALAVLSNFSYNKIIEIISKNDYTTLRQVPKLGEKKAQIIIVRLQTRYRLSLQSRYQRERQPETCKGTILRQKTPIQALRQKYRELHNGCYRYGR